MPGLAYLVRSRNVCPLWSESQMELAHYAADFAAAEPREVYLTRAKLLVPAKAEIWYRCGLYEFEDKQPDRAWESWRRSLALSDAYLRQILDRAGPALGPRGLLQRILPDRADLLATAAAYLYPSPSRGEGPRPFQERALALLAAAPVRLPRKTCTCEPRSSEASADPRRHSRPTGRPWPGTLSGSIGAANSPSLRMNKAGSTNRVMSY